MIIIVGDDMDKTKISNIINMLDRRLYNEIEDILNLEDQNDSWVKLFWGYLYWQDDYKKYSERWAKKYFKEIIQSNDPLTEAFDFLAQIESHKDDSIKILKAGREKFPNSEILLMKLINILDENDVDEIVKTINIKLLDSRGFYSIFLLNYYFRNKNYKAIIDTDFLSLYDFNNEVAINIKLIEGYSFFELGRFNKSSEVFAELYRDDITNITNYFSLVGFILSSWKLGNELRASIKKLPYKIDYLPVEAGKYYFDLWFYFKMLVDELAQDLKYDREAYAKLRGLRGVHTAEFSDSGYINDVKYALKVFPKSQEYIVTCAYYYEYKDDYRNAFDFGFNHYLKAGKRSELMIDFEYIEYAELDEFDYILNKVKSNIYEIKMKDEISIISLGGIIIKYLFDKKRFSELIDFLNKFEVSIFLDEYGFEIAYANKKIGNNDKSKYYYEQYIGANPETINARNNLSILYEESDELEKVVSTLKDIIEIDESDKKYANWLKRIEELIITKENEERELLDAKDAIRNENFWIVSKMLAFSKHRDESGFIACSYKNSPHYLEVSGIKADEIFKEFIEKKYILKLEKSDHGLRTNSNVYKINPYVLIALEELEFEDNNFSLLYDSLKGIGIDAIYQYGFDYSLQRSIDKIDDEALKDMVRRDVKENFLALITKSYKSSIVMSGSILEAIILNRIRESNIKSYKILKGTKEKAANVVNMGLHDLLYVAFKENLIEHENYHHSHAIRCYRNLIHPGVEERKSKNTPKITYENAKLAWDIMKKVLKEI